jgi:hypothetical protein
MTESRSIQWASFVNEFLDRTFEAQPHWAVYQGRHEFDGRLPDWSESGLRAEVDRLRSEREHASAFDPSTLDQQQRFERDNLISAVGSELFWRTSLETPYTSPDFYSDGLDPNVYVSREYAPLSVRLRAYTTYARAVPEALQNLRTNLRTPLPRTFIALARTSVRGLASYYKDDVPGVFASVRDAELQEDFRQANAEASVAMLDLDTWFESLEPDATNDFAMGAERFSEMLRATERVDIDLDELERVGRSDLERNLEAIAGACNEYAPGESVQACVLRVQADKPDDGPVNAAIAQLGSLRDFVVEQKLVSIPGTEEALVQESPPYMRWNAAFINIPGPYEAGLPSTYYISPPDPSWSEEDQNAYVPATTDLLFISVHEVWPGHFLQFLHAHETTSTFGKVFSTYGFSEGWAHYVEEMIAEAGLGQDDPTVRIGQLLNALLRNVRFLSAIGLHTGRMTVEESEQMFRENAYQDPGNARQQAARGTFDPAYLNYTMGKLMIRRLREDWTATRGGRTAWREFHDEFLSFGGPPIPLVRAAMMGELNDGALF